MQDESWVFYEEGMYCIETGEVFIFDEVE